MSDQLDIVTGAFSYTGRHIAERLLAAGRRVKTLTGHPDRPHPFGDQVAIEPFRFDDPGALAESLRGAATLYNTYWIRFAHGAMTFDQAVANTRTLFAAARAAGVRRVVHLSVTNPTADSPYPYFRGKALAEQAIVESGLSYAIVRPTVAFGLEAILVSNLAWLLSHMPVFVLPSGEFRLQPVFVGDVADLAVDLGSRTEQVTVDAVGPETYTFGEFVGVIGERTGGRAYPVALPANLALALSQGLGLLLGDVVLTRDELHAMMDGLLVSSAPPTCHTSLSEWLAANGGRLGLEYRSDLRRHFA